MCPVESEQVRSIAFTNLLPGVSNRVTLTLRPNSAVLPVSTKKMHHIRFALWKQGHLNPLVIGGMVSATSVCCVSELSEFETMISHVFSTE